MEYKVQCGYRLVCKLDLQREGGLISMYVRRSKQEDLQAMLEIYEDARAFMRENGNPDQWGDNYPEPELLRRDIELGNSYVVEDNGKIIATFAFIIGEDPTYYRIENGMWLNREPYGTIHRLAGKKEFHGLAGGCIDWCKCQIANLRADTHEDNKIMQHLLEKNGFVRCGTIYLANGAPRIAYQYVRQNNPQGYPQNGYRYAGEGNVAWDQPPHGNYYQNGNRPTPNRKNDEQGFGIASMVLGIIALVLFFSCINIPLAILAITFGIVQIVRKGPKGMAISGIVMGGVSIFLMIIMWMILIFSSAAAYENQPYYYDDYYYDDYYDYFEGGYRYQDDTYSDDFYEGYYTGYADGLEDGCGYGCEEGYAGGCGGIY